MSAGTITLANNSNAVTGVGTTFTTELAAGDFIVTTVGGITYTLPVKSIGSGTQIVLVSKYSGPTQAGAAWQAVPRAAQNQITAELVAQTTAALRGLNYDKQNWQAVFSASGNITVVLPDGSTFTGPSWQSIKDTLALIDIDAVTALANQVRTDAQQVATDKGTAQSAAQAASTDASTASSAKTAAVAAKTAAETAKTDSETAKTAAVSAKTDAEAAKTAAEAAASSVHPENLLHKDQNLDDLPDKSAARSHLDVYSKAETDGKGGGYIGQSWWHDKRSKMPDGCVAADGQQVDQVGPFADLYADVAAGNRPTTDEATWQADPTKRNCYVLNSSTGKMRLPDRNGVQPGSIKAPVMRGDGGSLAPGSMQKSALPNVKSEIYGFSILGTIIPDLGGNTGGNNTSTTNALNVKRNTQPGGQNNSPSNAAGSDAGSNLELNLRRGSDVYADGVNEARMNALVGCFVIRYAGRAQNAGSLDAMTLSARMESINTDMLAKNVATNARIDYALISGLTLANDGRQVIANPFGNNTPVDVQAELLFNDGNWYDTGWVLHYTSGSFGTRASYAQGVGIVLRGGRGGVYPSASDGGSGFPASAVPATPIQCRIHIRKITA
ncbi:hypothetical protein [Kluyvera sp. EC_51]|uniref:hypothetical protein n=1 Tax=Kluyvera sp. EC_51 TaxID=2584089 RepID=UPI00351D554F